MCVGKESTLKETQTCNCCRKYILCYDFSPRTFGTDLIVFLRAQETKKFFLKLLNQMRRQTSLKMIVFVITEAVHFPCSVLMSYKTEP